MKIHLFAQGKKINRTLLSRDQTNQFFDFLQEVVSVVFEEELDQSFESNLINLNVAKAKNVFSKFFSVTEPGAHLVLDLDFNLVSTFIFVLFMQ